MERLKYLGIVSAALRSLPWSGAKDRAMLVLRYAARNATGTSDRNPVTSPASCSMCA